MTAGAPTIRLIALPDLDDRPRVAALVAACAAMDVVAAGMLLVGTSLAPWLEGLAVAVAHGTAVLLLFSLPRERPGRRWLCVASALAVPGVGVAVVAAILATRGRGTLEMEHRRSARPRPVLTLAAMQRLGDALSPCDALDCGDEEQRRGALSALSRRGDPEAIALLRRAAAGRDPDLALSAALVLDEICERAEPQLDRLDPGMVRHAG